MKRDFRASVVVAGFLFALLVGVDSVAGGEEEAGVDKEQFAQLMKKGEQIAAMTCTQCHGPQGQGMVGPPLRQNLENARGLVRAVIQGSNNMPPLGSSMSDEDLAAVATYVRNSWGNSFGAVTEQQVAEFRK